MSVIIGVSIIIRIPRLAIPIIIAFQQAQGKI